MLDGAATFLENTANLRAEEWTATSRGWRGAGIWDCTWASSKEMRSGLRQSGRSSGVITEWRWLPARFS